MWEVSAWRNGTLIYPVFEANDEYASSAEKPRTVSTQDVMMEKDFL